MGIDRSDVRFVINAGAPRSLEHYQQESGRAGRDGLEAECLLIYSPADFMKWRVMLEQNGELTDATRQLLREMERYATRVGCRHRHLAEYFGDRYPEDACGACDYCLDELEPAAAPVVLARKILSCVARVGQRFGATHVSSVLRGHTSDQVRARRHDQLSTFGLLAEASNTEVRAYIEQLVWLGFLNQTDDAYPVLMLSAKGLELLKDETSHAGLTLARQRPVKKDTPRMRSRVEAESWQDVDAELFEALRAVRLGIARSRGVPPYVIFHDATLREMARLRPTSVDALLTVKGVGARKADDLGELFLAAIRGHSQAGHTS
jgi:ATP-dependent DNA helicase RecQ